MASGKSACNLCHSRGKARFPQKIRMAYQPIVDIAAGRVFAHEALVRGEVQPGPPVGVLGVYFREVGPCQQRHADVREAFVRSAVQRCPPFNILGIHLIKFFEGFDVFVEHARQGRHETREWTYVRKDGSRFPVQLVATDISNSDGEITGFLCIATDISKIKEVEKESGSSNYFIVNINTKITTNFEDINRKYLKKLGSEGLSNRIDILKSFDK